MGYTSAAAREMSHRAIRFGTGYHVLPHSRVSLATTWCPGSIKSTSPPHEVMTAGLYNEAKSVNPGFRFPLGINPLPP
jgi:hypothetical protein